MDPFEQPDSETSWLTPDEEPGSVPSEEPNYEREDESDGND